MSKFISVFILMISSQISFSQQVLLSWSQQNIENYTKDMYDAAQELSSADLLNKNLNDSYWSEVFLTLNASVNHYSKDTSYLKGLANQITNRKETKLRGTSRLIIWDRITSGDITFEGKGLVIDNDLYTVAGRANQILQNLTNKNFGFITIHSNDKELEELKTKWLDYFAYKPVEVYKAIEFPKAKISEISSLNAVHALIVSLQDNPLKRQMIKSCLKKLYNLDEMPKEKDAPANYCNPDTYTFSYLATLFGDGKFDESKDASWWQKFWKTNGNKLAWNGEKGVYEVRN